MFAVVQMRMRLLGFRRLEFRRLGFVVVIE